MLLASVVCSYSLLFPVITTAYMSVHRDVLQVPSTHTDMENGFGHVGSVIHTNDLIRLKGFGMIRFVDW